MATAALIAWPNGAEARGEPRQRIDVKAGSLSEAIAELSRETDISVGAEGALPAVHTKALRGSMTIDAALARLLRGSGLVARRVGATAWRIERAPHDGSAPAPAPEPDAAASSPASEIVVRATKRNLTLENTPIAATVVVLHPSEREDPATDSQRVAERTEGLSLAGQGVGRNHLFLRGVADSPFGGKSQATVAIMLDDDRLTYIAPDPDIRLVDVDRVELLSGPQGSLYGAGALGGIYRIVTRRADPSSFSFSGSVAGETISSGDLGGRGSLVVNVPLVRDAAAVRLVAYGERSPGWLDTGERIDSNGTDVAGLRASVGVNAGDSWRIDVTALGQSLHADDSNYTYQPEAHARPAQLPEPHSNDVRHMALRVARNGATQIVFSTGYTTHEVDDRYDATQGAGSFGFADPQTLEDDSHYRLWDSELRMTGNWGRLNWLGGVAHLEAWQNSTRVLHGLSETAQTLETVDQRQSEAALFGEATLPVAASLDATLGGRVFSTGLHEHRAVTTGSRIQEKSRIRVAPSASLAWHPGAGGLLYVRYGSAVRQGGTTVGSSGEIKRLDEDELMALEGGWRETAGPVNLDLGVFHYWWSDIQSDVLLANGLVETANVGDGQVTGAQLTVKAQLHGGWHIDAGGIGQSALLTRDMSGFKLHDRRLPVVPSWTFRAALARDFALAGWDATVSASGRYVGPARLSFDPALDRPMGNYFETGLALEARHRQWILRLEGRNLLNARGDSFAYGNPFRIYSTHQYVRQDPRSVSVSVALTP